MKIKLEKQEETNNAAIDDDYIREVEEYSEESHSEEGRALNHSEKQTKSETEAKKEELLNQITQKEWSKKIA
jgi:hypothetical protein